MTLFPHGGDIRRMARDLGCDPTDITDFSASINPLGPPEWLRPVISSAVSELVHYPDPFSRELLAAAAERHGVPESQLMAGNGTSELLFALVRASGFSRALIPVPSYADYRTACVRAGMAVELLPLREENGFALDPAELEDRLAHGDKPALVFLARPNNPTGLDVPDGVVRALASGHPDCHFIVDEAFGSFVEGYESLMRDRPRNVAVLLSLTKMFAIPGLRLGLACAEEELIRAMGENIAPWSVNALAQAVGVRAMRDPGFEARSREAVTELREELARELAGLPGVTVYTGAANYLLCHLEADGAAGSSGGYAAPAGVAGKAESAGAGQDASRRPVPDVRALRAALLGSRLAIRDCSNFPGLDNRYFRLAVRSRADNIRLVEAMAEVLAPARPGTARADDIPSGGSALVRSRSGSAGSGGRSTRPTAALMVQGTTSNAGKSVIAAALCRILKQDGVRVAPFKAQNMSLNSHVTAWGEEMGRAQVLQAQACGLAPRASMNPVLLKPSSDTGSQVIVMGRPVGNMRVREYVAYKPTAFAAAKEAYDGLAAGFDAVILEGAGSPAEINLKSHDMVNMAMARYANARVLLVGDIDRGGVFAALTGTMELLSESERALVGGYVLNRFRGDPSLLDPALAFMRETTGKPVLGVVPNMADLGLPEEDSVSFKAGGCYNSGGIGGADGRDLDIALLDLPHISNFTDFDALAREPDVGLRVVRRADELGRPDAVILPGSKNTLADLASLREHGLDRAVEKLAREGRCEVVGVCAGLQMLGTTLKDPLGLESARGEDPGLGLLPLATELLPEKTLLLSTARHLPSGLGLEGYEIHHGATRSLGKGADVLAARPDGQPVAWGCGRVWGTYLHGVFDADGFRRWWLNGLRARKGLPTLALSEASGLDAALDRLADTVRSSLDMDAVYALLGL